MKTSMDENAPLQERFAEVFAHLREQEVEQFYAHYQLWVLHRRLPLIEEQIAILREHLSDNQQLIQAMRPSAVALAVLARLQSNGVSDIDVLDQMLERGEEWLDRMMQRLDYCEQVADFIQGDYTQWCVNSLEGAYDWMDPLLGSTKEEPVPRQTFEGEIKATEEQLLQKLSLDDDEAMLEITLKQPSILIAETAELPTSAGGISSDELTPVITEDSFLETAEKNRESEALEIVTDLETAEKNRESEVLEIVAEVEQPQELPYLEELPDSQESPAPWYSVPLDELTPFDTGQSDTMHSWIKLLQADAAAGIEEDETEFATYSMSEILPPPVLAEPTESSAPEEIHTDELSAPELEQQSETSKEEPSVSEPEMAAATPDTDESISVLEEHEPIDILRGTELPALLEEETSTTSLDEVEEPAQLSASVEPGETAPPDNEVETLESTPIHLEIEPAETASPDHEAETLESIPTNLETSLAESAAVDNEAEPIEAASVEEQTHDLVQGTEESSDEIAETTIIRDASSSEDEEHAWYEYLGTDEQQSSSLQSQDKTEEQGEPQTGTDPAASQAGPFEAPEITPELYEYVIADEAEDVKIVTDSVVQDENRELQRMPETIEGWQTWNTSQADTQLTAIRAIQPTQEVEPEILEETVIETGTVQIEDVDTQPFLIGSEHVEASGASEIAGEPAIEAEIVESETVFAHSQAASTEETLIETSLAQESAFVAEMPPPIPPEKEQQARGGFWQRLFGRKRRK